MDLPDDIFDNDDGVDVEMDAHARAEETGKEDKKEKVVQSTAGRPGVADEAALRGRA